LCQALCLLSRCGLDLPRDGEIKVLDFCGVKRLMQKIALFFCCLPRLLVD
jgi:hypothetical protein